MSVSTFDKALALVLHHEGPFSSDPRDPGGPTKFGISQRAYPSLDIPNLTAEAAALFCALRHIAGSRVDLQVA